MSIRFAPAKRLAQTTPIKSRRFVRWLEVNAANDNDLREYKGTVAPSERGLPGRAPPNEAIMHAALRHFAKHGLGAARAAREHAEAAFFAGDNRGYDWWLGVTQALDRRLAQEAEHVASEFGNSPHAK